MGHYVVSSGPIRARAAYLQFCDFSVFDVTYKTNKFKMPFALFTGVNHYFHPACSEGHY